MCEKYVNFEKVLITYSLEEIGLSGKSPSEIVLTTFSPDKRPHASVAGITTMGNSKVLLRIFTDTKTFKNIIRNKAAVINIVKDVNLLASIALRDFPLFGKISLKFEKSGHVKAPRLAKHDAHVEIEVTGVKREKISDEIGSSEVAHIVAKAISIGVTNPSPHPFKRSEFFVIESAILATRINEALKRDRGEVARKKFLELSEYVEKCRRIAPRSKDLKLMTKIKGLFKNEMG